MTARPRSSPTWIPLPATPPIVITWSPVSPARPWMASPSQPDMQTEPALTTVAAECTTMPVVQHWWMCSSEATQAINGGGMYNATSSNPSLTDVTFNGNAATSGGGMYNYASSPTLTGVVFYGIPPPVGAEQCEDDRTTFSGSGPRRTAVTFSSPTSRTCFSATRLRRGMHNLPAARS